MKTTVDIPDEELEAVMRHTGATTKKDAVVTAITEFNRRRTLEALVEELGTFEQVMTLDELMRQREDRAE